MATDITIYDIATGEIIEADEILDDDPPPTLDPGQAYIEGAYDGQFIYCPGGVPTDRPALVEDGKEFSLTADGVETITIPLVNGTEVRFRQDEFLSVGTESLEIKATIAGTYEISLVPPFPYQVASLTVKINAA